MKSSDVYWNRRRVWAVIRCLFHYRIVVPIHVTWFHYTLSVWPNRQRVTCDIGSEITGFSLAESYNKRYSKDMVGWVCLYFMKWLRFTLRQERHKPVVNLFAIMISEAWEVRTFLSTSINENCKSSSLAVQCSYFLRFIIKLNLQFAANPSPHLSKPNLTFNKFKLYEPCNDDGEWKLNCGKAWRFIHTYKLRNSRNYTVSSW